MMNRETPHPSADHKATNPKTALGGSKPTYVVVPAPVLYEMGAALTEGACKYGSYNWRVAGARVTTYVAAARRHVDAFMEGEDIDPGSGVHHLSKAMAGLAVLRDAMICGNFTDDRPPRTLKDWMSIAETLADSINARFPEEGRKKPYTEESRHES